jgi:hypothetical protein
MSISIPNAVFLLMGSSLTAISFDSSQQFFCRSLFSRHGRVTEAKPMKRTNVIMQGDVGGSTL